MIEGLNLLPMPEPNTQWKDFLGHSINGVARAVAEELGKEVYWDEEDYY